MHHNQQCKRLSRTWFDTKFDLAYDTDCGNANQSKLAPFQHLIYIRCLSYFMWCDNHFIATSITKDKISLGSKELATAGISGPGVRETPTYYYARMVGYLIHSSYCSHRRYSASLGHLVLVNTNPYSKSEVSLASLKRLTIATSAWGEHQPSDFKGSFICLA